MSNRSIQMFQNRDTASTTINVGTHPQDCPWCSVKAKDEPDHPVCITDALAHYGPAQFVLRLSYRVFGDLKLEFSNRWVAFKQLHNLACELSEWE